MELDDMKLAWQALDARIARNHALNVRLLEAAQLQKAQRSLRPLWYGQLMQLLLGCLLALVGGALWATHLQQIDVLVCGLTVHVYGIVLIVFAARNLWSIHGVRYADPVLSIQRRLAELRAFKVRVEAPFNLVVCSFLWIAPTWVGIRLGGIAVPTGVFLLWAISSSVVGCVAIVLVAWWLRRTRHAAAIEANIAGRSIMRAQAALDEIARFERE